MDLSTSVVPGPSVAAPATAEDVDSNALKDPEFRTATLNGTRRFAFNCTLAFLFFRFSFLHEFLASRYGIAGHFLLILGVLSYLACFISGTGFSAFKYKPVLMWSLFGICMCFATAASTWRGGSVNVLLPYVRTTLPLVLLIPAVTYTSKEIQKILDTIGFAGATTIIIGFFNSDFRAGRLSLDAAGGSIQDSNDYAAHMLLILPAIAYFTLRPGRNIFLKLIGLAVMGAGFYEFLGTGSRGGMVSLIVTALYILKKGSNKLRMGLIFGVPILFAFALPFIPGESAQRLKSLFDSRDQSQEAADSKNARTILLQESLKITLLHPLLGIGPGEFENYQGEMAKERGERGMWHATHNGYTQVSSECGVPAAAFFIAAVVMALRSLRRSARAKVNPLSPMAQTLSVMLVSAAVCLCFLSQGYSFGLLVITGLAVCIERVLKYSAPAAAPA